MVTHQQLPLFDLEPFLSEPLCPDENQALTEDEEHTTEVEFEQLELNLFPKPVSEVRFGIKRAA